MISFFKDLIKQYIKYLTSNKTREFYKLLSKYGKTDRYKYCNAVQFLNYQIDVPDAPSFVWQFKEIFVDEIYKFKTSVPNPTIIDCGTNIGTSLLYFNSTYPDSKIFGFEADEKIAAICSKNLQMNNVNNVTLSNSAVWINNLGVEFSSDGADGGSIRESCHNVKVNSIRLKEILGAFKRIDILKMDIEGAEYEVIKDCCESLNHVLNIFIEYHSWNGKDQRLSEILAILEMQNFRYYLDNVSHRKQPFINKSEETDMDLQLNIYAYKQS